MPELLLPEEFTPEEVIYMENYANEDLEQSVKLPYVVKNRVLFSVGRHNNIEFTKETMEYAFKNTEWDDHTRSLYLDHVGNSAREWVGDVKNIRMEGDKLIGDLYIVDKSTAVKLAYGAKFGISPEISGVAKNGKMLRFKYVNFSIVPLPADSSTYLNSQIFMNSKIEIKEEKMEEEETKEEEMEEKTEVAKLKEELDSLRKELEEFKKKKKDEDEEEKKKKEEYPQPYKESLDELKEKLNTILSKFEEKQEKEETVKLSQEDVERETIKDTSAEPEIVDEDLGLLKFFQAMDEHKI